jgi:hypothetical protein
MRCDSMSRGETRLGHVRNTRGSQLGRNTVQKGDTACGAQFGIDDTRPPKFPPGPTWRMSIPGRVFFGKRLSPLEKRSIISGRCRCSRSGWRRLCRPYHPDRPDRQIP